MDKDEDKPKVVILCDLMTDEEIEKKVAEIEDVVLAPEKRELEESIRRQQERVEELKGLGFDSQMLKFLLSGFDKVVVILSLPQMIKFAELIDYSQELVGRHCPLEVLHKQFRLAINNYSFNDLVFLCSRIGYFPFKEVIYGLLLERKEQLTPEQLIVFYELVSGYIEMEEKILAAFKERLSQLDDRSFDELEEKGVFNCLEDELSQVFSEEFCKRENRKRIKQMLEGGQNV